MEKRNIALNIILTIVTCGLYGLYWFYKLTDDTHQVLGRQNTASGGMAILYTILTCGIYSIYWSYKMGDAMTEVKENYGLRADRNLSVIYLILTIFGLGIIAWALLQSSLNDIVELGEMDEAEDTAPEQSAQELPAGRDEQADKPEQKD